MIEYHLGICQRVLGLEVGWFPVFWETPILTPKVSIQVFTSTSSGGGLHLLHILSNISCQLSSVFFILSILIDIRYNLGVVLNCISLKTNKVEQFLKCLSAFWYSFVEKSVYICTLFSIGLFDIWFLEFFINFGHQFSLRYRVGENFIRFLRLQDKTVHSLHIYSTHYLKF